MTKLAIVGWGSWLPQFQLTSDAVSSVLGGGRGTKARVVASHDEDSITLATAAARAASRAIPDLTPSYLFMATSMPPYLVKSGCGTIHAALSLPRDCRAVDAGPSTRSGVTALIGALEGTRPSMVVAADTRMERAGATGELDGGDGAVAFVVGDPAVHRPIATLVSVASATIELMDRWQLPSERVGVQSDERGTESAYLGAAEDAIGRLFDGGERRVDILVVASEHKRLRGSLPARTGITAGRTVAAVPGMGCAGAANAGLLLAHALETARAGERILLVSVADGVDAAVIEVHADGATNTAPTVADQVNGARTDLPYATYLAWRGLLSRDTGRRPPLAAPAPAPTLRSTRWKYGLVGVRCRKCKTVHLPPERICRSCRTTDDMEDYPVADQLATVRRITTDWLAWSPQPPLVQAVVEFDDGGRLRCEVTDVFDGDVNEGDRVEMSFRVLRTVDGIHNYFWKAMPVRARGNA